MELALGSERSVSARDEGAAPEDAAPDRMLQELREMSEDEAERQLALELLAVSGAQQE